MKYFVILSVPPGQSFPFQSSHCPTTVRDLTHTVNHVTNNPVTTQYRLSLCSPSQVRIAYVIFPTYIHVLCNNNFSNISFVSLFNKRVFHLL